MLRFNRELQVDLGNLENEVERYRHLASDLKKLAKGIVPNISEMSEMPFLEERRLAARTAICFVGLATGHPLLPGSRREVVTSEIIAFAPQLGWARTKSRWYRLGSRADKTGGGRE